MGTYNPLLGCRLKFLTPKSKTKMKEKKLNIREKMTIMYKKILTNISKYLKN
jgi:hypothetical protein